MKTSIKKSKRIAQNIPRNTPRWSKINPRKLRSIFREQVSAKGNKSEIQHDVSVINKKNNFLSSLFGSNLKSKNSEINAFLSTVDGQNKLRDAILVDSAKEIRIGNKKYKIKRVTISE